MNHVVCVKWGNKYVPEYVNVLYNMVKRHTKPSAETPKGGIIEKLLPLEISNLSLLTKSGEKTKVGYKFEDGKKVRYSKKSNEIL